MPKPAAESVRVCLQDLDHAANAGVLQPGQVAPLWEYLSAHGPAAVGGVPPVPEPAHAPAGPTFDFTHTLYYLGGMLAIGAATLFLNESWQRLGPWGLLAVCVGYAAACVWGARALERRGLAVPAGIVATLAVCLVPLATWSLQHAMGLWPEGEPLRYAQLHTRIDWRWVTLELVTVTAAATALWALRHPFLVMPLAMALWYLSMDLARLVVQPDAPESWRFYRDFSMFFGLLMTLLAFWVDVRSRLASRRDYAFWLYLLGVVTFWGALTARESSSELARAGYAALNVVMLGLGALLQRRVFAACGGLGLALYLGHLSHRVFQDSLWFPLALTLIGLGVMAAGILWQRHETRLRVTLLARLPAALREWVRG
jgi:hypothetical protein